MDKFSNVFIRQIRQSVASTDLLGQAQWFPNMLAQQFWELCVVYQYVSGFCSRIGFVTKAFLSLD